MKLHPFHSWLVLFGILLCPAHNLRGADVLKADTAIMAAPVVVRDTDGLLKLSSTTPDIVIRYTLDGSDPTVSAGEFLVPTLLPPGIVLKARAFSADGKIQSDVIQTNGPVDGVRPLATLLPVTQNRDWRSYDWTKRHAACVALMKERQPELVFLGDSITHFWGGEPRDARQRGSEVWKKYFAKRNVVNLGYGWDRTENVLWRLRHGEFEGVSPKVVVLMIGTNNLGLNKPEEIAEGIRAICAEIRERSPKTKILLLAVFPRGQKPDGMRARVGELNALIAKLDGQNGITFLDIGEKFLNPDRTISPEIMNDYLHPTAKGYEIWAEAMEPTLKRLLETSAN